MPLERVSYQGPETFLEFYKKEAAIGDDLYRKKSELMANAVHIINKIFEETVLYGETSHLRIGLVPDATENQPKVRIDNIGLKEYYYVSFAIPQRIAPWDHAWIEPKQVSFEELEKYILLAMKRSEAWDENPELTELYRKYEL